MAKAAPAGRATPIPPAARRARRGAVTKADLEKMRRPSPAHKDNPIKVRALETGYYDHVRRREGDVFVIANEQAFSERWMERVDPRTPEKVSTSKSHLEKVHDEILGGKSPRPADRDVLG